jgi:hypothetical protein
MNTILIIYGLIGLGLFAMAIGLCKFGKAFSSEKFSFTEILNQFVWFGVLWPVTVVTTIYMLMKHAKPKRH